MAETQKEACLLRNEFNLQPANRGNQDISNIGKYSREESNTKVTDCRLCGKHFSSDKSCRHHVKLKHERLKCKICDETFTTKEDLKIHGCVQNNENDCLSCLCDTCGKAFSCWKKLRDHNNRMHKQICDEVSSKMHSCDTCGKEFPFLKYLKRHVLKHGEKNFVCESCGKRFEARYMLKVHQECHLDTRPYECTICKSTYKRQRNLWTHEQEVHGIFSTGPGKEKESVSFPCSACTKQCTTKKKLEEHMRIHTGERPYHCDICGKSYISYCSLYTHRKVTHEGKKLAKKGNFVCNVCDKCFSSKNCLDVHLRIHTGEKPYVCEICGHAFSLSTSLRIHMDTHTDLRPYSCSHCNKTFKRRGILMVHMRTHEKEKPLFCEVCGRGFTQMSNMKKHKCTHPGKESLSTKDL